VYKASAPSEPVQSRDTQLEDEEVVVKARNDSLKGIVSRYGFILKAYNNKQVLRYCTCVDNFIQFFAC
jgi:hypothetical protein